LKLVYRLDRNNRILSVGGDWDKFALENGGEMAVARVVVGENLFDFIAGAETKSYVNAILFACRETGQPFCGSFQCNSDEEERRFIWNVTPDTAKSGDKNGSDLRGFQSGKLCVSSHLVHKSKRIDQPRQSAVGEMHARCSICCADLPETTPVQPLECANCLLDCRTCPPKRGEAFVICLRCRTNANACLSLMGEI
jgi:hypothetical protein